MAMKKNHFVAVGPRLIEHTCRRCLGRVSPAQALYYDGRGPLDAPWYYCTPCKDNLGREEEEHTCRCDICIGLMGPSAGEDA